MSFIPIPAIDLLNGNCVRLHQGNYNAVTCFADTPAQVAQDFVTAGARRIHIVDLDGAKQGKPINTAVIAKIVAAVQDLEPHVTIELGGGLRNLEDVQAALASGIDFVVLGTAAIRNPHFLTQACQAAPGKVLLGLDARAGKLAVEGWLTDTELDVTSFAMQAVVAGIAGIIHTDIERDGAMGGPNVAATANLAAAVACPVYASGGVRSLADLEALQATKIAGVIIGKAIYTGAIQVSELFANATQYP